MADGILSHNQVYGERQRQQQPRGLRPQTPARGDRPPWPPSACALAAFAAGFARPHRKPAFRLGLLPGSVRPPRRRCARLVARPRSVASLRRARQRLLGVAALASSPGRAASLRSAALGNASSASLRSPRRLTAQRRSAPPRLATPPRPRCACLVGRSGPGPLGADGRDCSFLRVRRRPGPAARGRRSVLVVARAVRLLGLGRSRRVVPTRLPLLRARRPPPGPPGLRPDPSGMRRWLRGRFVPRCRPSGGPPPPFCARRVLPPRSLRARGSSAPARAARPGPSRPPPRLRRSALCAAAVAPSPAFGAARPCGSGGTRCRRCAPLVAPPLPSGFLRSPSFAPWLPSALRVGRRVPPGRARAASRRGFGAPGSARRGGGAASPPLFPPAPRRAFFCSRPPAVAALRLSGLCVLPGALSRRLLPLPPFRPPVPRWGRGETRDPGTAAAETRAARSGSAPPRPPPGLYRLCQGLREWPSATLDTGKGGRQAGVTGQPGLDTQFPAWYNVHARPASGHLEKAPPWSTLRHGSELRQRPQSGALSFCHPAIADQKCSPLRSELLA